MNSALVGMGYQVQNFTLDAWLFGSPQSRTRLFVVAASPGVTPLDIPQPSHSHPEGVKNHSLGRTANDLHVSQRQLEVSTPLKYVTIGEATSDIPYNHDGRTNSIRFPGHRTTGPGTNPDTKRQISCIPLHPPNQNIVSAKDNLHPALINTLPSIFNSAIRSTKASRSYSRTAANKLLPTITASYNPKDCKAGRVLHWEGSRCLMVMEARRAQSYPDRDVLVGTPAQ
ncbi:MAG: DNA methyltransferase Dim-2 [Icmadophila ericetorum]|nr:DNA methyltransferase Dim-2 [Icmadophila ericetorum]